MARCGASGAAYALALGIGDLAGLLPLERVTAELSHLADRSLERALARRSPSGRPTSRRAASR